MQNEVTMEQNPVVDKSFKFAVRIINLYKHMIREHKECVLSKQILRCGTSIGANIMESQQAQSRPDFVSKLNIALKEAVETNYWLRLLRATDYLTQPEYTSVITDCKELEKLLTAIIKTTRNSSTKIP